jgi:hypothetical protein
MGDLLDRLLSHKIRGCLQAGGPGKTVAAQPKEVEASEQEGQ